MGLATGRGVTICFADLDGADGLWVPEERTILVNRGLSEQRMNEVIEHELGHVVIDDQHAALDAGVWQGTAPPPTEPTGLLAKRWATPVLSAAAFVALVGGVTVGLTAAMPDGAPRDITKPTLPTPIESNPFPGGPTTSLSPSVDANGHTSYRRVTITPTVPGTPGVSASGSRPAPADPPPARLSVGGTTPAPPSATSPPPSATPTPEPTTPDSSPTSPAAVTATVGAGASG